MPVCGDLWAIMSVKQEPAAAARRVAPSGAFRVDIPPWEEAEIVGQTLLKGTAA